MALSSNYSIYLHIPFCVHRCAYCDFNTYAGLESLIELYTKAICHEIVLASQFERIPVHTIFLGGGTPSLLPLTCLDEILSTIYRHFDVAQDNEITMEANPGTLSAEYLKGAAHLGINRLSLGMQSAHPDDLRILERQHNLDDVVQSVLWARDAGLENINLDLIYGLPYQTLQKWQGTLSMALSLQPAHLSLYALTLEHGTPMNSWVGRGLLPAQDEELAADMYEFASNTLDNHGYAQYEISNWAKVTAPGEFQACRHNLQYWRSQPWLGFGAGAHGFVSTSEKVYYRTMNVLAPAQYIQRLDTGSPLPFPRTPATNNLLVVPMEEFIGEYMMMGLRLTQEGISDLDFSTRFGFHLEDHFPRQINRLIKRGLLEWRPGNHLCLTRAGRFLGNQVFQEFI